MSGLQFGFSLSLQGRGGGGAVPPPIDFQSMWPGVNIKVPFGHAITDGGDFAADPYALGGSGDWETVVPPALLAELEAAGNKSVRMPIDPGPLMAADSVKRAAYHARFGEAIADLVDTYGFWVIVDLHAQVQNPSEPAGYGFEEVLDGLAGTKWTRYKSEAALLAAYLAANFDRQKVLFEPFNEFPPDLTDSEQRDYMVALHAAVRAAAPGLAIVIKAGYYDNAAKLVDFGPLDDPNTAYSIHFYDPVLFTFQTRGERSTVSRLSWPPIASEKAGQVAASPGLSLAFDEYFDTPQDAEHISPVLDDLDAWATANSIAPERIIMGEVGAWGDTDPPMPEGTTRGANITSREHYHRATRLEVEARGYSGNAFSLISPNDGFGLSQSGALTTRLKSAIFGAIGAGTTTGAAAGTPGTLPTGWVPEGPAAWRVIAVGTDNGIPYLDLQVSNTGGQYLNLLYPTDYGGVAMLQNEIWEASGYFRILSGAFEFMRFTVYTFGGGTQQTDSAQFEGTLATVDYLRHGFRRHLHTVANAAAASGNAVITITPTGTAVVRIGAPTFRKIS